MSKITAVDPERFLLDIHRDLTVSTRSRRPGPPQRIDGMTVGFVTMQQSAPHGGELHPDGDEILYVISGKVRVVGDTSPALELGPGEALRDAPRYTDHIPVLARGEMFDRRVSHQPRRASHEHLLARHGFA